MNTNQLSLLRVICSEQIKRIEETLLSSGVLSHGKSLIDFLITNKMADNEESVFDVFQRATFSLSEAGQPFYGTEKVSEYQERFLNHVCRFEIILGSPILTNAGRRASKSISACSIPPINLSKASKEQIAKIVGDYHTRGMGAGFYLDDLEDPVEMVKYLNQLAIHEVQSGQIERSVGNMGVLSINHPRVLEFISVKTDNPHIQEWKFNLSVNMTDEFMNSLINQTPFKLADGRSVNPRDLMIQMAKCAHASGDPGVIFMDRINQLNRVPHMGRYKTVVPCGEVSLFEGEVCQFAYLNLAQFAQGSSIDKGKMREAIHTAVLLLDNAVELNISNMPNQQSIDMISGLRRIGLGLCGFAELLQFLGLPYSSAEGRQLALDLMSFINYECKQASVELAKVRGPFKFLGHDETRRDLFFTPFKEHPTRFVSADDWNQLESAFTKYGIRNLSTTILPPSGRSSLIAGVTASIEPPFRLTVDSVFKQSLQNQCLRFGYEEDLHPIYEQIRLTGSLQSTPLPAEVKEIFKSALEISPEDHVKMTAAFQQFADEGISKTVNLPNHSTIDDVVKIYQLGYALQLKGLTIYRDGCRHFQPKPLNTTTENGKTIIDVIYGPIKLTDRIAGILKTPLFERLKRVHQNGTNYLVDGRQTTSRYEHSVGAMALVQRLGGSETDQVAALFHDISHTAFSHVADLVFSNKEQNFHDNYRTKFLESELAQQVIKEFAITPQELACETIPMVKGGELNVDRLDYCIRDLLKVNRIYHPQYSSILNNITVDEQGELRCKNIETARLLFTKFIEVNREVYFQPKAEAASTMLSWILKRLIENEKLRENDLFQTDDHLIRIIRSGDFRHIFDAIHPNIEFETTVHPTSCPPVLRKLRYLDPKIVGLKGALTDHCQASKELLKEYLATPTIVYYSIPAIEQYSQKGF